MAKIIITDDDGTVVDTIVTHAFQLDMSGQREDLLTAITETVRRADSTTRLRKKN